MTSRTFDRETLLDLSVNLVPLGIMLFFVVVFVLLNPFGVDPVGTAIQMTIMVAMLVSLAVLTYVSGRAISNAEREMEAETGAHPVQETTTVDTDPES